MNLEQIKQDMMMEEAIASAELAGANLEDIDKLSDKEASNEKI